ncbi:MAG: TIGR02757 family protein [Actinobacteria bacterium]|nr:TIGR02757 family protein [Actinomycetota bacterium]
MSINTNGLDKDKLEELYLKYNKREYVHPDPIEFLYDFGEIRDREIVALVASSLAYGRVEQILKSVARVLKIIGRSPYRYLNEVPDYYVREELSGFRHRFNTGDEMAGMLSGVKAVIEKFGSLNKCIAAGMGINGTLIKAMEFLTSEISCGDEKKCGFLLPSPAGGSACKRMNLFLRWMVRTDAVDPGGWDALKPSDLIIPLDTHIYRNCRMLGLTSRKQANWKTAVEITEAFREIVPEDPVRYDFIISRIGIRKDLEFKELLT